MNSVFQYPSDLTLTSIGSKEKPFYSFVKRAFDIIVSLVALIILFIPFLIIALIIFIDDPKGSPFYVSERVGKRGKTFKMYKFRSMVIGAEDMLDSLMKDNDKDGPAFKMHDDPRVTKIGHFLRETSIDELPQFWKVLKGDMSLVGTRPPTKEEFENYDISHKVRLSMKPGITGLWQVSGRSDITDFDEVVSLDLEYIDNWSLTLDFKILVKTVGVVLKGSGSK